MCSAKQAAQSEGFCGLALQSDAHVPPTLRAAGVKRRGLLCSVPTKQRWPGLGQGQAGGGRGSQGRHGTMEQCFYTKGQSAGRDEPSPEVPGLSPPPAGTDGGGGCWGVRSVSQAERKQGPRGPD